MNVLVRIFTDPCRFGKGFSIKSAIHGVFAPLRPPQQPAGESKTEVAMKRKLGNKQLYWGYIILDQIH